MRGRLGCAVWAGDRRWRFCAWCGVRAWVRLWRARLGFWCAVVAWRFGWSASFPRGCAFGELAACTGASLCSRSERASERPNGRTTSRDRPPRAVRRAGRPTCYTLAGERSGSLDELGPITWLEAFQFSNGYTSYFEDCSVRKDRWTFTMRVGYST